MTQRIGNTVIITEEAPSPCELCGTIDELRPYGPERKRICFDCAMVDENGTKQRFLKLLED